MGSYTVKYFSIENIDWEKEPLFEIVEHTICIWKVKIIADADRIESLCTLLNPEESVRANRYHHEKDRRRFIISRSALRILLGRYLNTKPGDIVFAVGPNKKPFLKQPIARIHYNTSHVESCALIAVANSEVGIDIEKMDTAFDWKEILYSTFTHNEIEWVEQSKDPRYSFYMLWTRKEALAKATGKGLQDDLSIFPSLDGVHILNDRQFDSSWEIGSFKVDGDTTGSIAHQPSIIHHKFYSLNTENLCL